MPLSPHLPSARGKAAAAPLRASDQPIKARRHLALIPHRAKQAVSFGYFSLGPQRKVTRAPAGDRKPAAGEPSRVAVCKGEKSKGSALSRPSPRAPGPSPRPSPRRREGAEEPGMPSFDNRGVRPLVRLSVAVSADSGHIEHGFRKGT